MEEDLPIGEYHPELSYGNNLSDEERDLANKFLAGKKEHEAELDLESGERLSFDEVYGEPDKTALPDDKLHNPDEYSFGLSAGPRTR